MAVQTTIDLSKLLPASFTAPGLTEAQFVKLCRDFPDAVVEYTAEGEVLITPPTDFESGKRVAEVIRQLGNWAIQQGKGDVGSPEAGFFFADGSRRSPDACWCDSARWAAAKQADKIFPVFAPDFVIEVRSTQQRARPLQAKMEEYIDNGVKLGWLIDPIDHVVTIYRPGQRPEVLENSKSVSGEGPVAGFILDLKKTLG